MSYYNFAVIVVDHYNVTHSWNLTAVSPKEVDRLIQELRNTIDSVANASDIGSAHPKNGSIVDEAGGY